MGTESIVAAALALGNLVLGFIALFQRAKNRTLTDQFDTVSEGLNLIEKAMNDNKVLIAKTGAGDKIAATIAAYGPVAKLTVDAARTMAKEIAGQLSAAKAAEYEAAAIAIEVARHAQGGAPCAPETATKQ